MYSTEWGQAVDGKIEINSEDRRLVIVFEKEFRRTQLWVPFWSIKQVIAVEAPPSEPALDLVLVLSHAPHFFISRKRQQSLDEEHHQLGQVVNNCVRVGFNSPTARMRFLAEPEAGLPQPERRKLRMIDRELYANYKLAPVYAFMTELSAPVAFQVSPLGLRGVTILLMMFGLASQLDAILCSGTITRSN